MQLTANFSDLWFFLQQEAYLINSCMGNGLTSIRRAAKHGKGEWYSGFFQLSIGLERLMKTCLIIDHINRNQLHALKLRQYNHDLLKLFDAVSKLSVTTTPNPVSAVSKTGTGFEIFEFLAEFASKKRYHNLDSLTSKTTSADPLAEWKLILDKILSVHASSKWRNKNGNQAQSAATRLSENCAVLSFGLDKAQLTLEEFLSNPDLQDKAASFVVFYLLGITRPIIECLSDLAHVAHVNPALSNDVPDVNEMLFWLADNDRKSILDRKLWPGL